MPTAEIDQMPGVLGGWLRQRSSRPRIVDRGVEQANELLDLAELVLPAGLDPALPVGHADRDEERAHVRVLDVEQAGLDPVVLRGRRLDRRTAPFLVMRTCRTSVVVSTCQLPNPCASRESTAVAAAVSS